MALSFLAAFALALVSLHQAGGTYFTLWSSWNPSSLNATRERTRQCLPQTPFQQCTQSHFLERFDNCPTSCSPNATTQSSTGCVGTCAEANTTITSECGATPGCTYTIAYMCVNEATCTAAWTTWTDLTSCGVCGNATHMRQRECRDNSLNTLSTACPGASGADNQNQTVYCSNPPCPVFTAWNVSGSCSATCGGGMRNSTRDCIDNSGPTTGCVGPATNMTTCETQECPVYSKWINTTCSSDCAEGNVSAVRNCSYLGMLSGLCPGASANGTETALFSCNNTGSCGTWGAWLEGSCSVTCGGGMLNRTRNCTLNNVAFSNCEGGNGASSQQEVISCNNNTCPSFSSWAPMGPCSEACDGGLQNFTRECILNGSATTGCVGDVFKQEPCNTTACSYGLWFDTVSCNASCDGGFKTQQRNCSVPGCTKTETQTVMCNTMACSYGPWFDTAPCNASCDGGFKTQQRNCTDPGCTKTETQTIECNTMACSYGPWFDIAPCNASCDGGFKTQQRNCTDPGCTKTETQTIECNTMACSYGPWFDTAPCNASCDGGFKTQQRNCSDPGCTKTETQTIECNTMACSYGPWFDVDACSAPCGDGNKTQQRNCSDAGCSKTETRVVACNQAACTYGPWQNTSQCTVTCGGGTMTQQRQCDVVGCNTTEQRTVECNTQPCFAVGGPPFTSIIILASFFGSLIIVALVYILVLLCVGTGAVTAVGSSKAFAIGSIQVASLGAIVWYGKSRLVPSKKPKAPKPKKSEMAGDNESNNLEAAVAENATPPGADNATNNNSAASTNKNASVWVHSRSLSGSRPRSTLVSMARRASGMDLNPYSKMK